MSMISQMLTFSEKWFLFFLFSPLLLYYYFIIILLLYMSIKCTTNAWTLYVCCAQARIHMAIIKILYSTPKNHFLFIGFCILFCRLLLCGQWAFEVFSLFFCFNLYGFNGGYRFDLMIFETASSSTILCQQESEQRQRLIYLSVELILEIPFSAFWI